MKKYAFFDIDGTIYDGYSVGEFILFLCEKGYADSSIRDKKNLLEHQYQTGIINYSEIAGQIISLSAVAAKGLTVSQVHELGDEFLRGNKPFFPFVPELFQFLEEQDFHTYLISASILPCVEAIARLLKTDRYFCSQLEIVDNKYTGNVTHLLNNDEKKHTLHRIVGHLTENRAIFGFGDSPGDIELLKAVDHAFVINPEQPLMRQLAEEYGWHVVSNSSIIPRVKATIHSLT